MEAGSHNQGYWLVLREDQGNVIYSSNNITAVQNPQVLPVQEQPRYITEIDPSRHYIPPQDEHSNDSNKESKKQKPKEDDNFWDKNKVKLLLTLCLENKNIDKDTLWDEISNFLRAPPEECKKKYWHLRRTYFRLLKKKRTGKDIKWMHYGICEEVFTDLQALPPAVLEPWDDNKVRRLLSLYIENLHKFHSPGCLQKDIWKEIAAELGTTGYNCYHKFKNLRRSHWHWLNRSRETGKAIKWPYHQYFERINYNDKPCTSSWDRNKIKLLLEAYAQIAHKFRNPKMQKKELWNEISRKVGESPPACDKKFRNLKLTYKRLKAKANSGRLTTKWRYYRDFEAIYSNSFRYIDIDGTHKVMYRACSDEDYIKQLLTFYLENKEKFRDPLTKKKNLWKMIAPKLGLTSEECDKKFRNLKQTYIRLAFKKKQSGKSSRWPYFTYFEKIFHVPETQSIESNRGGTHIDDIMKCEIRRVVEDVQEKKDNDTKFERLLQVVEESNNIQRERNKILLALINRK